MSKQFIEWAAKSIGLPGEWCTKHGAILVPGDEYDAVFNPYEYSESAFLLLTTLGMRVYVDRERKEVTVSCDSPFLKVSPTVTLHSDVADMERTTRTAITMVAAHIGKAMP